MNDRIKNNYISQSLHQSDNTIRSVVGSFTLSLNAMPSSMRKLLVTVFVPELYRWSIICSLITL